MIGFIAGLHSRQAIKQKDPLRKEDLPKSIYWVERLPTYRIVEYGINRFHVERKERLHKFVPRTISTDHLTLVLTEAKEEWTSACGLEYFACLKDAKRRLSFLKNGPRVVHEDPPQGEEE